MNSKSLTYINRTNCYVTHYKEDTVYPTKLPCVTKLIVYNKLFGSTSNYDSDKSKSTFKKENKTDSNNILTLITQNNRIIIKQEKRTNLVTHLK